MKKIIIILGIIALIAGGCCVCIPSGMYRSVETQTQPVSLHSVRNATNGKDAFLRNARLCGIAFSTERYNPTDCFVLCNIFFLIRINILKSYSP